MLRGRRRRREGSEKGREMEEGGEGGARADLEEKEDPILVFHEGRDVRRKSSTSIRLGESQDEMEMVGVSFGSGGGREWGKRLGRTAGRRRREEGVELTRVRLARQLGILVVPFTTVQLSTLEGVS